MSISFNVLHNNVGKKLTVSKGSSIGDLVNQSCVKFGLGNGELYYNSKKLDNSLPIRFSSLVANCKLILKFKEAQEKLIGVKMLIPGDTVVKKVPNSVLIGQLVTDLSLEMTNLTVSYLGKTRPVGEIVHQKLYEVVGDVDNLVLRFNYVKDTAEEQRLVREKETEDRQERQRLNREREAESVQKQNQQQQAEKELIAEAKTKEKREEINANIETNETKEVVLDPVVKDSSLQERVIPHTKDVPHKIDNQMIQNVETKEDVIYEPSSFQHYENPDEDYEFTVNHAKLYQDMIKYKPTKRKVVEKVEEVYKIRVKFPNNYILEFQIENTQKFGELIKKIDGHVTEEYKSNYDLKLSYPPFKKFDISFDLNSKRLIDIDDLSNHILLIFESKVTGKGPYLVNQNDHKKFTEMPEIQLEQHRKELPDEPVKRSSTEKNGKKTPKWLKLGK